MKSNKIKIAIIATSIAVVGGLFAGCSNPGASSNSGNTTSTPKKVTGSITASGSTALQPLAEAVANTFASKNPGATVTVQGGGSGTGLTQVSQGAVQIGDSDIFAKEKLSQDESSKLEDHKVCAIGFAVVTTKDTGVTNLTKSQVQDIFTGKVTNWKDVGGKDLPIKIVHRPNGSGTRATFKNTVMGGKAEADNLGMSQDSSGAVKTAMEQTPGSISYLALSYLTSDVKKTINTVKLDGVEATTDNITGGKYPFWSYEHMYTKGKATGVAKAFIDYVMSSDSKAEVLKLGYIPSSAFKK